MTIKRNLLSAIVAITCSLSAVGPAMSQPYPSRPITIVVPYPAGGPTDILARVLAERMRSSLGQPLIVENVSGASGSIGVGRVARAAPDGYTISVGNSGSNVLNGAILPLQYDLLTDFEPIALIADNAQLIVAKTTVPAKDLNELIAWLKANQDKVSVGIAGPVAAVSAAEFQNRTVTRFQLVPYRGAAAALQDLIGGQIELMFDQVSNALPQVRAGKVRAFAVTSKARLPSAPEIPTADEAGLPGFYASLWSGMWAPKGTPKDIIAKLNAAVTEALADPKVRRRFSDIGQEIPPLERQTPEALGAFQKAEAEKWWPIAKAANIKAE